LENIRLSERAVCSNAFGCGWISTAFHSPLVNFLLNLSNDGDDASESDSELSELEERMDTGVGEDVLRPKFL
jgi:hypothetical protein